MPGGGDLEVYFDPAISIPEKIIFSKYVPEHVLERARDVKRATTAHRAKDNSPEIHHWGFGRQRKESRQGRKMRITPDFFRPVGAGIFSVIVTHR